MARVFPPSGFEVVQRRWSVYVCSRMMDLTCLLEKGGRLRNAKWELRVEETIQRRYRWKVGEMSRNEGEEEEELFV